MSLILEALRKLDREKQVPDRGFLVIAPAAWPAADYTRRRWAWALLAVAVLALGAALWQSRVPAPAAPQAAAPVPAPRAIEARVAPEPTLGRRLAEEHIAPPVTAPARAPAVGTKEPAAASPVPLATPTAMLSAATAPATSALPAGLVLQAISERDGRPVALIGDRLLREGDEIEGARILKINDASVEIEFQGRHLALRF